MRIEVKEGVVFRELNDQLFDVCSAAHAVWLRRAAIPTITSAFEGKHMAGSLHYKHLAWDLRARSIPDPKTAVEELREILNSVSDDYDIIFFDNVKGPRIHIEFQPVKRRE